jgi:D-apionolactonase
MEDQRNWTDASFKTSSTPASLGYHHTIDVGGVMRQRLTFRVKTEVRTPRPRDESHAVLIVGEPTGQLMPPVGLGSASHGEPLSAHELDLLRKLSPAHLRVDVRPGEIEVLERALGEARALGGALELALFVNGNVPFLDVVVEALERSEVTVARILVFDDSTEVSPAAQVDIVRSRIPGVPVGGGTNIYFNELNRNRPDPDRLDVISYSVNPQIHAFDELSLVESLEAQGETVRATRAFSGDTPIAVTPVTFRPRFNAVAVVEEPAEVSGLPRQVDPRQMSLFGAVWTVGSVKNLAEAGTTSLTYFETSGWRGVVERDCGSDNPAFPSQAGEAFPLYYVLARVLAWRGAELVDCTPSNPLSVTALGVRREGRTSLLLANLDHVQKTVSVEPRRGSGSKIELGPYEITELEV